MRVRPDTGAGFLPWMEGTGLERGVRERAGGFRVTEAVKRFTGGSERMRDLKETEVWRNWGLVKGFGDRDPGVWAGTCC